MLPYRDSFLTKVVLAVFFVLVVGYAYYEARAVIYGPRITVTSALEEVSDPYIVIEGQADRIAALSMNGQPIAVTEDGAFQEPILLSPGLNRIVLDAEDRYGRKRQEVIEIVYTASADTSSAPGMHPAATTTATATSSPGEATTTASTSPSSVAP